MKNKKPIQLKKTTLSSAVLWALGSAHGATINVDGTCTLVEAIQAANNDLPVGTCGAGSGADVIQMVSPNTSLTISAPFESSSGPGDVGLPIINSTVTIEGNGLTLVANNNANNFRMFDVSSGGDLTLRDTTVSTVDDGYGVGSGLLVYNGRVTLDNTTFASNNQAIYMVYSVGSEINNSTIRHNVLRNTQTAPGIGTYAVDMTINNTSFIDNRFDPGAPPPPPRSSNRGVGISSAGGASFVQSTVTMTNTTISGNQMVYGGGVTIREAVPPFVDAGRWFAPGVNRGVIQNDVTIRNSTITNNTAFLASGILDFSDTGTLTLQGSIVAGNQETYGDLSPNIYSVPYQGTLNLDANNIIGDRGVSGAYGVTLGASDSSFSNNTDDNLYPLTLTNGQLVHPLKVGSVAIDGNLKSCFGSTNDQEGKARGIDGDGNGTFICDIGSLEHSLPMLADDAPCTLNNAIISANNDSSVGGCQPGIGHDIILLPENGTITLSSYADFDPLFNANVGLPRINSGITIDGRGATIERDSASLSDFSLLFVDSNAQLNLVNTTITGASGPGAAIIGAYDGNMNIVDSAITGNYGGGMFDITSINSSVLNSTIDNNQVLTPGIPYSFAAGLSSVNSIGFELKNSTISNNDNSILTGLTGGLDFRGVGMSSITNTTISGNTATNYGGMVLTSYQIGSSEMQGITMTNNEAGFVGGMITVNTDPNNQLSLRNSIISGDLAAPAPDPAQQIFGLPQTNVRGGGPTPYEIYSIGTIQLDGDNVIGQLGNPSVGGGAIGPSDVVPAGPASTVIDPVLADNGGNTLTHLPVAGGPAVDLGSFNCGLRSDQVGNLRPWDGDDSGTDECDAGAVELNSIPVNDIIFKDGFDPVIIIRTPLKDVD